MDPDIERAPSEAGIERVPNEANSLFCVKVQSPGLKRSLFINFIASNRVTHVEWTPIMATIELMLGAKHSYEWTLKEDSVPFQISPIMWCTCKDDRDYVLLIKVNDKYVEESIMESRVIACDTIFSVLLHLHARYKRISKMDDYLVPKIDLYKPKFKILESLQFADPDFALALDRLSTERLRPFIMSPMRKIEVSTKEGTLTCTMRVPNAIYAIDLDEERLVLYETNMPMGLLVMDLILPVKVDAKQKFKYQRTNGMFTVTLKLLY